MASKLRGTDTTMVAHFGWNERPGDPSRATLRVAFFACLPTILSLRCTTVTALEAMLGYTVCGN